MGWVKVSGLGLSLAAVVSAGVVAAPQTPTPRFEAAVDVLQLDVSVLDRDRNPVRNLTAGDFTVEVDGKATPVVAFTAVSVPAAATPPAAPWMREITPDVATNQISDQGRLVVVLIDYLLDMPMTVMVRKIAHATIEALSPDDLAAVLYLWQGRPQNFTSDRERLFAAIDQPYMPFTDKPGAFCWCDVCRLDTMTMVADALRDVPQRRKEIVYVGRQIVFQGARECATPLKDARNRLFQALDRANVTVSSVDPSGLETGSRTAESRPGLQSGRLAPGMDITERVLNLGVLPARTGGRVIAKMNEPDREVPALLAESEAYYVVGIDRPVARADGRDRKIEVKVRQRGVKVSSRRAYPAPAPAPPATAPRAPDDPPASLLEAVAPVWPARTIPLQTTAAAFAVPGTGEAAVVVVSEVRQPWPESATGDLAEARSVALLAGAWDRNGQPLATHTQTLSVQPVAVATGRATDLRYQVASRLSLRPGAHEVRVALEDLATGDKGSVYTELDVPNFKDDRLSLSGLVVGATGASPLAPAEMLQDLLPIIPTAQREFTKASRVAAFVRAYQGANGAMSDVTMTATLLGVSETPIVHEATTLAANQFGGTRSADYLINVPVADLAPGPYLLTLEATLGDKQVTRHMRFEMK